MWSSRERECKSVEVELQTFTCVKIKRTFTCFKIKDECAFRVGVEQIDSSRESICVEGTVGFVNGNLNGVFAVKCSISVRKVLKVCDSFDKIP